MPRNPSLSPSELESARALARKIVDEAGSQTAAVAALGVSKAALSDFLNGGSVGMKLIAAIAHVAGCTIDEVLGHRPYSDAMSPRRPPAGRVVSGVFVFPNEGCCVRVRESG